MELLWTEMEKENTASISGLEEWTQLVLRAGDEAGKLLGAE